MWLLNLLLFFEDFILCILMYPFLILFLTPVIIYRSCVLTYVRIFYPTYIPTTVYDQQVAYDCIESNNKNPLIFSQGAVANVNGRITLSRMREILKSKFLDPRDDRGKFLYPKLFTEMTVIGGYVFFKPLEKINLDDYITELHLDHKDLDKFTAKFISRPFLKGRPLWEVVVVQCQNESKIHLRFHHMIADGYSQIHLYNLIVTKQRNKLVQNKREPEPGFFDILNIAFQLPRRFCQLFLNNIKCRNTIPLHAKGTDSTLISTTHIYLGDLKQIYRKTQATFTAISLSLFTEVLIRVLKGVDYGDYVLVGTSLPWPNHPAKEGKMANHLLGLALAIPLKEMTRMERIKAIDAQIKKFYADGMDKLFHEFFLPIVCLFPISISGRIVETFQTIFGLKYVVSNLVSFEDYEYEIDGIPIICVKPLITRCSYNALLIGSSVTYGERCEITFAGTQAVAKDQYEMNRIANEYYIEEMEALLEEISLKDGFV